MKFDKIRLKLGDSGRFELPTSGLVSRALRAKVPAPAKGSRTNSRGRKLKTPYELRVAYR
jgi:hypothetical protein